MKKIRPEKIPHFSYVSGIAHKLQLNLQVLMCWLLLEIYLSLKVKQEKVVKVVGVVNQVSYRGGTWFYAWKRQICLRPFCCPNFIQIDQILRMKWHLVPYGTFGSERVKTVNVIGLLLLESSQSQSHLFLVHQSLQLRYYILKFEFLAILLLFLVTKRQKSKYVCYMLLYVPSPCVNTVATLYVN